jgi:hypothetical protein
MPVSARTASNDAVNCPGPVSDEEPELGDVVAEIHDQITDLRGGPSAVEVRGGAQQVHEAAGHFQHEEHVDPLERDCAVHREEVAGQHG